MNRFISTRNKDIVKDSKIAIIDGLCEDGGLYVMDSIPEIKDLYSLKDYSYPQLAENLIGSIFNDINPDIVHEVCTSAYSDNFDTPEITPLSKVGDDYFLELHHGPTCAFKDIALQFLPRLIFGIRSDFKDIVILSATSGDTGKAALEGFANVQGTRIKVLFPYKMVSTVQERQMTTTRGNNVEVLAVKGNFDDCQALVKDILENEKIQGIHLSSANSINIARLIPQVVYYFKAYFDLLNKGEINKDEPIDFVVPTGNFGDILAGYIAKKMGLPIGKLVLAANRNNVLEDFINTGIYDANRELYNTSSPSIDILVSSNLERLLYFKSKDTNQVKEWMASLKKERKFTVSADILSSIQEDFVAYSANEEECAQTIREVYEKYGYLIDTHTAIAASVLKKYPGNNPKVVLSTASAYKFSKDVYKAITGIEIPDDLNAMKKLNELTGKVIPKSLKELEDLEVRFKEVIEKNDRDLLVQKLEGK